VEVIVAVGEVVIAAVIASEGVKAHARSAGLSARESLGLLAVLVAQDEMG
jgi:hypothetical protein